MLEALLADRLDVRSISSIPSNSVSDTTEDESTERWCEPYTGTESPGWYWWADKEVGDGGVEESWSVTE